jgi:FKBP-type peptidyl-prolyl cis-trans isomerase 2
LTATIQALKKVTLSLIAESAGSKPVSFAFIYGIAGDGLCPFEQALQDKSEGDSLSLTVADSQGHDYFGHLFFSLRQTLGLQIMPKTFSVKVEITSIKDADNRELVQSLAKAVSGCGGSCGCGCS